MERLAPDRLVVLPREANPVIRFGALEASEAAFRTAVLTDPDADRLATRAFLSALARTAGDRVVHSRTRRGLPARATNSTVCSLRAPTPAAAV
jgi:hypothetical protein